MVRWTGKGRVFSRNIALVGVGMVAILAQVACFRTLFSLAGGNELSFGIALGIWLFFGAIGSLAAVPLTKSSISPQSQLAFIFLLTCVTVPLSIFLLQYFPFLWGFLPGQVASLGAILFASVVSLAPVATPLGAAFTVCCRGNFPGRLGISWVYITEAIGSGIGGLLGSLALSPFLESFQLGALTVGLSAIFALFALSLGAKALYRYIALISAVIFVTACAIGFFNHNLNYLHQKVKEMRSYPGFEVLKLAPSRLGELIAVRQGEIVSLYANADLVASYPNQLSAEESAHLPLLAHPNPKRVLLVGGGLSGELGEMLKHPIEQLVYLENDYKTIEMGEDYLGSIPEDERLKIKIMDMRRMFVSEEEGLQPGGFDVILLNMGDPSTAQVNRNYTQESMLQIKEALASNGILAFFASADENYIGREMAGYLANLRACAESVFPQVKFMPGARTLFLAGGEEASIATDAPTLAQRLSERGLDLTYYDARYLQIRLMPDRFRLLTEAMDSAPPSPINEDERPIAYYYDLVLFAGMTSPTVKNFLVGAYRLSGWWWVLIPLIVAVPAISALGRGGARRTLNSLVFLVGGVNISMTVVYIIAYQTLVGYVYQQVAILFAVFMVGLTIGGLIPPLLLRLGRGGMRRLLLLLGFSLLAMSAACIVGPLLLFAKNSTLAGGTAVFALLGIQALLGGMVFSSASMAAVGKDRDSGRAGGFLHAADSLGAMVGSLATSVLFLPLIGMRNTSYLLSAVLLGGLVILFLLSPRFFTGSK